MRTLLLTLLVGCNYGRNHETINGSLYLTAQTLILCDYGQTVWASNGGRWDRQAPGHPEGYVLREENPLLGSTPSTAKLSLIVGADLLVNFAVMAAPLPAWFKSAWFGTITAVETVMVTTNNYHGVCGMGDWSPGRIGKW